MLPRICLILFTSTVLVSPTVASDILPLWKGTPPNHQESDLKEYAEETDVLRIHQVQDPSIEVFLPANRHANGQAVVICPGGGYRILAYDMEGTDIAKRLNSQGIAGIVLKYRLPEDDSNVVPHLTPLLDVHRAIRMVRHRAEDWSINPDQIGVMGFSAGGHLASTALTRYDSGDPESKDPIERESSRPDFAILMYPVISMADDFRHSGSRRHLLGEQDSPELALHYSAQHHVTADTPPTFLVHSADDKSVPVQNSLVLYEALLAKGVPAEMHLYPTGGHGYGLAHDKGHLGNWSDLCLAWLESIRPE